MKAWQRVRQPCSSSSPRSSPAPEPSTLPSTGFWAPPALCPLSSQPPRLTADAQLPRPQSPCPGPPGRQPPGPSSSYSTSPCVSPLPVPTVNSSQPQAHPAPWPGDGSGPTVHPAERLMPTGPFPPQALLLHLPPLRSLGPHPRWSHLPRSLTKPPDGLLMGGSLAPAILHGYLINGPKTQL